MEYGTETNKEAKGQLLSKTMARRRTVESRNRCAQPPCQPLSWQPAAGSRGGSGRDTDETMAAMLLDATPSSLYTRAYGYAAEPCVHNCCTTVDVLPG